MLCAPQCRTSCGRASSCVCGPRWIPSSWSRPDRRSAACTAVAPGVPAEEVDRAARRLIAEGGYGDAFIHRTGHGIGMETHEEPYIVDGNAEPLRPGHAFSIEPGIYVAGEWGARIEDIVVCTEDGSEVLNRSSRELISVA